MDKDRIREIRESKEKARYRQWMNYQKSGESKYYGKARAYEELVDICDIALNAADDHYKKVNLQTQLVELAVRADRILHKDGDIDLEEAKTFMKAAVTYGKLAGYDSRWEG